MVKGVKADAVGQFGRVAAVPDGKVRDLAHSQSAAICKTKRTAYCCFESKLSRILQEQGRVQIGKAWAKPKDETCKGFTLAEFQMLDLSVMDFSEVYAEFIDAAKLPNELETTTQIQERIEAYLQANGNK